MEQEKSVNKIIYKSCSELDIPVVDKLRLLQMARQDLKIETLLAYLSQRTERNKSVVDLEEKVRQDMIKSQATKRPIMSRPSGFGGGKAGDMEEIEEKLRNKKLPDHVREEIEKEMKRMGGDTQSAVTLKYIETLLEIPWLEGTDEVKDLETA